MPTTENEQLSDIQDRMKRFEDKLDRFLDIFVSKDLWNATTARLQVDIANLDLNIKQDKKWALDEHEKLRTSQEKAIHELTESWEDMKSGFSRTQIRARDFIISSLVSFLIGGGAIGLVTFLVTHH